MSVIAKLDRDMIASDFHEAMKNAYTDKKLLDEAVEGIKSTTAKYPAQGTIASFLFYQMITVDITNGKKFNGKSGGIAFPGGGGSWGDVYTNDIDRLYRNTHSFQFITTPVYFTVNFFDGSSNFLGTFQAGALSTSTGTGGGTGSWE
ncbi:MULTISPECIES: VapA/VapB family virulence-associated protein [Pseudomonas]|jgi:hypothetical protein|uniref:VapA/VapB family virulence-associated protein n=2 Tax=Pseudomonas TaxID=286 RepID=A0A7M2JG49_PSEFL|nr:MULTISPECIES: VapA/VapB family virulence-associated protein [Pseudomonas]AHC35585.1 virulence associated protein VapA [Pseudomonas sp. TKP]MBL1305670.1 VapA/VapB family virulence-associated protein [Pseudomonas sp.]PMX15258.1 VapA/VapB family virulence-associated protein [Pseudomonas sp. MPBC4-3]PMX47212.1 VapA/VapB family virulence-associated protein [Pseudomonas sp. FW301-21B01]PMY07933.1 VapA/VapB family virulence-associated protein [Pseudomonas sp. MPR-R5A]